MVRQQYPLEALRRLRDERAEAQARGLAEQLARSAAAEAVLNERERVRREHALSTDQTVRAERARLAAGQVSGADLLRATEFESAARARAQELERSELEAGQRLAQERAQEKKLRAELGRLEAEAQLARNHEASFHEQHATAALRAEEEAALEQWNARRR
jgi:hypothetical protein